MLSFVKYHGAGNDFIIIDNRAAKISLTKVQIAALCHRRFGIGADGLMLLETAPDADFGMLYYNSDGGESTMCGNGGRCMAAFARRLGIVIGKSTSFNAIDGRHEADFGEDGSISLHMQEVRNILHFEDHSELDTGSPHYVQPVHDAAAMDVFAVGRKIRRSRAYADDGINVNFVESLAPGKLRVRTYERGVEDETLSCGTGVTAAAIAATGDNTGAFSYDIVTPGGNLRVSFNKPAANVAINVVLTGPAQFVFEGSVSEADFS